jgi:DNA-binding MarR family transcriptional regulator
VSVSREAVVANFAALRGCVASLHTEAFLAIDVTMPQAQLLYIVATRPDLSMTAIAAQLNVGLSAVSGLVDRLVEHGYLARHEDPTDRRQHLVSATRDGLAVIDRLREIDDDLFRRLLVGLDASELAALDRGIVALVRQATLLAADASQPTRRPERTLA